MSSNAPRIVGNIAALIVTIVVLAYFLDRATVWWGGAPFALCAVLRPLVVLAQGAGMILGTIGLVVWIVSMFNNPNALGMLVGGYILSALPGVLPHYLGTSCVLGTQVGDTSPTPPPLAASTAGATD